MSVAVFPLAVVEAPTPRFPVPRYDTGGTYPQVHDDEVDLRAVNRSLRRAVLADQGEYEPRAGRNSARTVRNARGIYSTSVDRRLLSASSLVVSALLPATKLYPAGTQGKTWVAMTVRVPSGRPVRIDDLFADPPRGLRVLANAWLERARGTWMRRCIQLVPSDFRPTARNYRNFALTPRGLAVGFWQPPSCTRLQTTVPYATLRPHLSRLGAQLVAGVRSPR